jgi:hypothetical protein
MGRVTTSNPAAAATISSSHCSPEMRAGWLLKKGNSRPGRSIQPKRSIATDAGSVGLCIATPLLKASERALWRLNAQIMSNIWLQRTSIKRR